MLEKNKILVASLYKFVEIDDLSPLQDDLYAICNENNIMGTILLADEGINGTISGNANKLKDTIKILMKDKRFSNIEIKYSLTDKQPFNRMKVRLKKEIVTIGLPNINPNKKVGTYVKPEDWNDIISNPDVIVIDTRNFYETSIGKFTNSIIPETKTFRDFPKWADNFAHNKNNKTKKIAMYCTGGIRCEKATSYMKEIGFHEVYHLKGGILKYLETIPETESNWEGDCFVFDQRVSVKQDLKQGEYKQCYACKMPLSKKDLLKRI